MVDDYGDEAAAADWPGVVARGGRVITRAAAVRWRPAGVTETERHGARERVGGDTWNRVRPSRSSGPRARCTRNASLTPRPFTAPPNGQQNHATTTTTPGWVHGWAAAARARRAHALVAHTRAHKRKSQCEPVITGWGKCWQQCVTDRPAYESRSTRRPIQLYIQGVFSSDRQAIG